MGWPRNIVIGNAQFIAQVRLQRVMLGQFASHLRGQFRRQPAPLINAGELLQFRLGLLREFALFDGPICLLDVDLRAY